MSTDSVLASIDDTLAGYEGTVSSAGRDAMRWTPERVICDGGKPLMPRRNSEFPDVTVSIAVDLTSFVRSIQQLRQSFAEFGEKVARAVRQLGCAYPLFTLDRRHRDRCRRCNPAGNPLPLPGGHDYHRRQKARQRRKARRCRR